MSIFVLAEIDLIRDFPVIGFGALVLIVGAIFLAQASGKKDRFNRGIDELVLIHAVSVPLLIWATLWCYQHPERLTETPDAWQYDMRMLWPVAVALDVVVWVFFFYGRWGNLGARAERLLLRANRLLAQGRIAEADATYGEGKRLLDRLKPRGG